MTNLQFAQKLRLLADRYEAADEMAIPSMFIGCNSKNEARAIIDGIGGAWKKRSYGMGEFDSIYFDSVDTGLTIYMPRNILCRRLNPEYECTPLLKPEEEAELENAGAQA